MERTCPCFEIEDVSEVDFVKEATNVYRTREFIVKQKIMVTVNEEMATGMVGSEDKYYFRTAERDQLYNEIFAYRGEDIEGKRIKSTFHTREYID